MVRISLLFAQEIMRPFSFTFNRTEVIILISLLAVVVLLLFAIWLLHRIETIKRVADRRHADGQGGYSKYLQQLDAHQLGRLITLIRNRNNKPAARGGDTQRKTLLVLLLSASALASWAQPAGNGEGESLLGQAGIIITIVLLLIPILVGFIIMVGKASRVLKRYRKKMDMAEADEFAAYLREVDGEQAERELVERKKALDYRLDDTELSGPEAAADRLGIIKIRENSGLPFVAVKKKAQRRPNIDPQLSKLIVWYLVAATFWLLFGTTVGQYLGIKFVAPDADQVSWLSFGRLRPVHTNAVFWGWASLAMIGLGYYVVPRVSNVAIASLKMGWYSFYLINIAVILGSLSLMAGINNGGGEYREYIWPIMLLFGVGLVLTLINYLKTVAKRTTREIYISNWYIISAVIFALVISIVAYVPWWQKGLGETIIQGYYMHQGVGMWFMLFMLGVVYYFLPQQLNRPIYSYSLGILAFWTQILFYTLIGTHHFVFSAIPWWLQTVAIVGSMGMVIPVAAGTANFLLTFKGGWYKVKDSYTLPFFLIGIIFYFTGSLQGTAEAFRYTNLLWHFTDFTVAHSHLTMYGIICFFLWAGIYALVPRLTGKEAPQSTVGAHFWMALIGLMFYTVPLMYGSTLKGLMWMEGSPFIESVTLMMPYWLWRAIGGSLMWLSHLFFAYNMYKMLSVDKETLDIRETAIQHAGED
ncbi:cbb3-type cytochrome c oxidase subunit I [Parapedobacter sp. 10938]|uniref:cbb3-type cytochrome c oxidase subunit I n=1 Tax=Parapedobacter flavus TaxID=3110225 RepID=UPI002DBA6E07|nr:cbb3-type cytochrome c oxidase subunit I [Parapedobacter sp. 10938]MEC3878606.1 cbb3-type cytochrome c oxidase subunit I [Parapedobacter sp. 10938]